MISKIFFALLWLLPFTYAYSQEENDTIFLGYKLKDVIILSKDPISEKFSVKKLDKIDIYLNPISYADPLRAILVLPASTNVDETANPALRGGSPSRSRVYLNGSPIVNPVRFGRDNGLGNFSLFNTEIIDKQYVYASNPPLIYGNSSAGLVQIETNNKLKDQDEEFQLSTALSNLGAMWNKKLSKKSFIQLYGNYQFDKPFIKQNRKSLENLNSFSTIDIGANTHIDISKNFSFNSFNYFIDQKYSVVANSLNFTSNVDNSENRFFSVNNVDYFSEKTRVRYSTMFDYRNVQYKYGNIFSHGIGHQYFNAISIKTELDPKFTSQYGIESSIYSNQYRDTIPPYYYARSSNSPFVFYEDNINFYYVEPYIYFSYETNDLGISSAIRKNVLRDKGAKSFVSYQLSSHYKINNKNRFILSGGKYHSYTIPNSYIRNYTLLSSEQIALDYYYESNKFNLTSAVYYKNDGGNLSLNSFERYDKVQTFGVELNAELSLHKDLKLNVSNTYIDQKQYISDVEYNTALNLKYFVKAQLMYSNLGLFNCSLLFTTRPGSHYTSVSNASFNKEANDYEPRFNTPFSSTFSDYKRFDFSINKVIFFDKLYLIAFATINNIFDNKNRSSIYYNKDYTRASFDDFQRRLIYFGMQVRF